MASSSSDPGSAFRHFMAAVQRPVPLAEPAAEQLQEITEASGMDDFDEFSNLVEAEYAQIMVPVPPSIVTAHQELVDYEIQHAKNDAMREYWLARRAPNLQDGVASIALGNAIEAYDYLWAEKSGLLIERADESQDMYSPRCNTYYTAIADLISGVWHGKNADHLLKTLEKALFTPDEPENVVLGKHTAIETAANILDLAHALRTQMKGPNRSV